MGLISQDSERRAETEPPVVNQVAEGSESLKGDKQNSSQPLRETVIMDKVLTGY